MNLNIANINAIVENDKLKPVKTTRMFSQSVQADSLFSEEIFGKFGSSERKKTFAYIELGTKIIHPEALQQVFLSIDPLLSKYILNKQKCSIQNGKLILDEEEGVSGVYYFIKNFNKIDFSLFKKKKPKEVNWMNQNIKKIFIDKYLIIPAAFRDIQFSKTAGSSQIQYAELNELYEKTIRMSKTLTSVGDSEDLIQSMTQSIQISVNDINKWFKERMKGKYGVVRGGLMKKSTDFSGRLVITTDNKLELGEVGLPWQVVLRIYEYFTLHELQKNKDYLSLIQSFLKINTPIDTFQLKNLIKKLNATPNILSPMLKDYFIEVANKIAEGKVILYKRDQWSLYMETCIE